MTFAYLLDVTFPDDWKDGVPDEVQDHLDMLPDPYRSVFVTRSVAYGRQRFWRHLGAAAEVRKSNPITWPARRTS